MLEETIIVLAQYEEYMNTGEEQIEEIESIAGSMATLLKSYLSDARRHETTSLGVKLARYPKLIEDYNMNCEDVKEEEKVARLRVIANEGTAIIWMLLHLEGVRSRYHVEVVQPEAVISNPYGVHVITYSPISGYGLKSVMKMALIDVEKAVQSDCTFIRIKENGNA